MSRARWACARSCIFLGLATLGLCWACSSSSSDGGTTSGGGTASSAGASPAGAGGVHSAGAGGSANTSAGASGAHTAGGSAQGGGDDAAGAAGTSTNDDCGIRECLVANTCLDKCGGSVVYTGCCSCVAPDVNQNTCGGSGNR